MEKPQKTGNQGKQKMAIRIGSSGSGAGAVLVWGGVVAIATLVSVSAIKFMKKRSPNKSRHPQSPPPPPPIPSTDASTKLELNNKNDDQGTGLRVLLQDSSPPIDDNHHSKDGIPDVSSKDRPEPELLKDGSSTHIYPTSLEFTETLIMYDKNMIDTSQKSQKASYLDVLLSDNSKPKSKDLVIDYGKAPDSDQFAEEDRPQQETEGQDDGEKIVEIVEVVKLAVEGEREVTDLRRDDKAVVAGYTCELEAEELMEEEQEYGIEEAVVEKVGEAIEATQKDQIALEVNMEAIAVVKEKAIVAPDASQIEEEYNNPQMELIEEEREIDDGETANGEEDKEVEITEDNPQEILSQEEEEENPQMRLIQEEREFNNGENAKQREENDIDKINDNPPTELIGGGEFDKEDREVETVEDNPRVILSKEDDEEDDVDEDEEGILEKGEESSEGTGDSSMESNAEAIWPAESIEEFSLEIKEAVINNQKLEEKIDEYRKDESEKIDDIYANGYHNNEDAENSLTTSSKKNIKEILMGITVPKTDLSNLGIWIWSASVILLLLVLVVPLLLSLANIVKLCLIVVLVGILSQLLP